ncbi:MAG: isoprenylcysteine carboxylmethyltransferase family protein [Chloroflexota bacterium]
MSNTQNTDKQSDSANVAFMPPVLLIILLIVGFVGRFIIPLDFLPRLITIIVGPIVTLASLGLFFWATRTMSEVDTAINPNDTTTTIMVKGPFKFSRNPIYLGMLLLLLGVGIWTNTLWFFGLAVLFVILLQWGVISREERYLANKFGDEYLSYKAQVRRWL